MPDALALVPDEVREPPRQPRYWDYDASVTQVQQALYKWKNLTLEVADELYNARRELSQRGGDHAGRWGEYCESVGVEKRTANRWLDRIFNGTNVSLAPLMSSDSAEWFTPWDIIERVQTLFGEIDLDPCSNDGVPVVPALKHFKENDDGLTQEWSGRVYMNPPYGRGIGAWVTKLADAHASGDVPEAVALVPARTDTEWFQSFRDAAVCLIRGRLRFSESETGAPFPSTAVYLGPRREAFIAAFTDIGDVWVRADATA